MIKKASAAMILIVCVNTTYSMGFWEAVTNLWSSPEQEINELVSRNVEDVKKSTIRKIQEYLPVNDKYYNPVIRKEKHQTLLHVIAGKRVNPNVSPQEAPLNKLWDLVVREAANQNENYMQKDANGNTPLHMAAYSGNRYILRDLLENRQVEASPINNNGMTPLMLAMHKAPQQQQSRTIAAFREYAQQAFAETIQGLLKTVYQYVSSMSEHVKNM